MDSMGGWRIGALALLMVGCASGAGEAPSENVEQAATTMGADATEAVAAGTEIVDVRVDLLEGTATAFERLTNGQAANYQNLDHGPEGDLDLIGCRWRAPGLYSFDYEWTPAEEQDGPASLLVEQGLWRGDQGFGWAGFVELDAPGAFSVPHDSYALDQLLRENSEHEIEASAHRNTLEREQLQRCFFDDSGAEVPIVVDPLQIAAPEPGTVNELVADLDLSDPESALLPLASFVSQISPFEVDRLFFAAEAQLESINASLRSDCLRVRSNYLFEGAIPVELHQTLRCPVEAERDYGGSTTIADDVWAVTIHSPNANAPERFAETVEVRPFAGVPELEAGSGLFNPTAALDATIRESEFTEILRLPWEDGLVAIGFYGDRFSIENYADPIVAVSQRFPGGGSGMGCREYAVVEQGDEARGFSFVVIEAETHHLVRDVGGEREVIDTLAAAGDRKVFFFDRALHPELRVRDFTVVDAEGIPVPCVQ